MLANDDTETVRDELQVRLARIRAAAGDFEEIRRQLHSVKGLAMAYGFSGFAEAAHALEDSISESVNTRQLAAYLDALSRELEAA